MTRGSYTVAIPFERRPPALRNPLLQHFVYRPDVLPVGPVPVQFRLRPLGEIVDAGKSKVGIQPPQFADRIRFERSGISTRLSSRIERPTRAPLPVPAGAGQYEERVLR